MTSHTEIDLVELRSALVAVLDRAIERRGPSVVSVRQNFYHELPSPEVYDVTKDAPEADIGSLRDDWDLVRGIAIGEQEPLASNLVPLSFVLRLVGEVLGEELGPRGG